MTSTTASIPLAKKVGFDPGYLEQFEDKLFIEGTQVRRRLVNFFVLLLLATVIATYGVLSGFHRHRHWRHDRRPADGTHHGDHRCGRHGLRRRAGRSLAARHRRGDRRGPVLGAARWIIPDVMISFTENGEIASRIQPGLFSLFTALGAGAAGAFIISRAEIANSMGGVAIAISLVPPLCVVGISISHRATGRQPAAPCCCS